MFADDEPTPSTTSRVRYICAQCGSPGAVDPGFTQVDARYATGRCTGVHEGKQYLVREDVNNTQKRKKKPQAGTR